MVRHHGGMERLGAVSVLQHDRSRPGIRGAGQIYDNPDDRARARVRLHSEFAGNHPGDKEQVVMSKDYSRD